MRASFSGLFAMANAALFVAFDFVKRHVRAVVGHVKRITLTWFTYSILIELSLNKNMLV